MSTPCLYSIIRYAPYAETEEFANIGVVLCAPHLHTFCFKLTQSNDARVSAFFRDDTIFPYAKDAIDRELKLAHYGVKKFSTPEKMAIFFSNLTSRRESIFNYSPTRVILADDPQLELDKIFDKFINHSDITKERREEILAKELRMRLNSHVELKNAFKKETLGGILTRFTMPFVARSEGEILCAIKPLAFDQREPGKMMEHCDSWVARISRAADESILNIKNVVFTIEGRKNPTSSDVRAMNEIRKTFDIHHITHFNHEDEKSIISFAKSAI